MIVSNVGAASYNLEYNILRVPRMTLDLITTLGFGDSVIQYNGWNAMADINTRFRQDFKEGGEGLLDGPKSALPHFICVSTARMGILLQWYNIDCKTVNAAQRKKV